MEWSFFPKSFKRSGLGALNAQIGARIIFLPIVLENQHQHSAVSHPERRHCVRLRTHGESKNPYLVSNLVANFYPSA